MVLRSAAPSFFRSTSYTFLRAECFFSCQKYSESPILKPSRQGIPLALIVAADLGTVLSVVHGFNPDEESSRIRFSEKNPFRVQEDRIMFQCGHYLQPKIKPRNDTPDVLPAKAGIRCINEQTTEVFRIPVFFLTRTSSRKNRNDLCGRYPYTSTSLFL